MFRNWPGVKTVKVTIDYVHHDGSTTKLETQLLDATHLNGWDHTDESRPSHFKVGTHDPLDDYREEAGRRNIFLDDHLAAPRNDYFQLRMQLPPVNRERFIYIVEHKEKPSNRVIARFGRLDVRPLLSGDEETRIAIRAENEPQNIYFFLEVPE